MLGSTHQLPPVGVQYNASQYPLPSAKTVGTGAFEPADVFVGNPPAVLRLCYDWNNFAFGRFTIFSQRSCDSIWLVDFLIFFKKDTIFSF